MPYFLFYFRNSPSDSVWQTDVEIFYFGQIISLSGLRLLHTRNEEKPLPNISEGNWEVDFFFQCGHVV